MKEFWRATFLYLALTIVLAYPLSIHPGSTVLSATPDTDLFLWTLQWDVHALTHQPWAIFDANIYAPERNTLAYSENLLGSAPLAAPILWLTGNAVLAMNLIVLLASTLCGVGTYVLARRLGVGPLGATLSGLVFAFSPPRFLRLDQLHLATIQWVPFGLASLHAYWETGRQRDLRFAAGLFALQALTSGHGAVFLLVAMAVMIGWRLATGASRLSVGWIGDLGLGGALLLLPAVLIQLPYHAVQQAMGLRRSLEDWAVPWACFLASSTHVHVALLSLVPSWHINDAAGPTLFPGVIPIVLAAAALIVRRRRVRRDTRVAGNNVEPDCHVVRRRGAGRRRYRRADRADRASEDRHRRRRRHHPSGVAAVAVRGDRCCGAGRDPFESAFRHVRVGAPLAGCVRALADRQSG